ncbi:MAG: lipopolysaccharide transport periplasmic protein LptA [Lysobacteraceae bacterium]|nr:MAG: lipopolysaccharide transport periplasmic protein LptA [Xanthomonadaceae bacterium]
MKPYTPLLLALLLGIAGQAAAEKADAFKPTAIDCDACQFNGVTGKARMVGNVVITRGSLRIEADHGHAERSPDGYQSAVVEANPGRKVRFRQKADGPGEQWMEGEAMRVEFDERSGMIKLFTEARVRRLADGKLSDEAQGELITYDSRTEMFDIRPLSAGGRGTIILQPRRAGPAPAAAAPTMETR